MIGYNCVMLELSNPSLSKIGQDITSNYLSEVNKDKCVKEGMTFFYEREPHITLIYGLEPLGRHTLYHLLKIKNRSDYLRLRNLLLLSLPELIIDTFDNDDCSVLKINFDNCLQYELLNSLSNNLSVLPNTWEYSNPYHPHLTLTYLNPNYNKSIISELIDRYHLLLKEFKVLGFLLSNESGEQYRIPLL